MLKYEGIVEDLLGKIESGAYAPNERLPISAELCDQYQVSKITIKRAMDELERLGIVVRRRGSGTFVKGPGPAPSRRHLWSQATRVRGTKSQFALEGRVVSADVKHFSIEPASPQVARALGIADGFVYDIRRVRILDGKPINVEQTYMPIDVIPGVTLEVLNDSIYEYIEGPLGLTIDSAHSIIRAVQPTETECAWLNITKEEPLLEVEQTAYLSDGTTFEYSIVHNLRESGEIRTIRFHRHELQ